MRITIHLLCLSSTWLPCTDSTTGVSNLASSDFIGVLKSQFRLFFCHISSRLPACGDDECCDAVYTVAVAETVPVQCSNATKPLVRCFKPPHNGKGLLEIAVSVWLSVCQYVCRKHRRGIRQRATPLVIIQQYLVRGRGLTSRPLPCQRVCVDWYTVSTSC